MVKEGRAVWALGLLLLCTGALASWHSNWGLSPGRYYDERFSFRNVQHALSGADRPANAYYPSLSYIPAVATFRAVNAVAGWVGQDPPIGFGRGIANRHAYLAARLLSVAYGLAALVLTFLIGRLCFDSLVGLLGAVFVASLPMFVALSSMFKPETLLLATTLLAVWLALRAERSPTLLAFCWSGAAVGLALAAKYNGGPVAFSVVVAAALAFRRRRSALAWLVVAGAVAALVFLALNPWVLTDPELYAQAFEVHSQQYEKMGRFRAGGSHLSQLLFLPKVILGPYGMGFLLGSVGLAGLAGWGVAVWRRRLDSATVRRLAILGGFLVGYTVLYVAASANLVEHNWFVLMPYVCLAAAWLVATVWRLAGRRFSWLDRRWWWAAVMVAISLLSWSRGAVFAYELRVPTTLELATHWSNRKLRDLSGRTMLTEIRPSSRALRRGQAALAAIEVDRLSELPEERLDLADALLFPSCRLRETPNSRYLSRLRRGPGVHYRQFAPRVFAVRGRKVIAVVQRWRGVERTGGAMTAAGPEGLWWTWQSPTELPRRPVSVDIYLKGTRYRDGQRPQILVNGNALATTITRLSRQAVWLRGARARVQPGGTVQLRLPASWRRPQEALVAVFSWVSPVAPGPSLGAREGRQAPPDRGEEP